MKFEEKDDGESVTLKLSQTIGEILPGMLILSVFIIGFPIMIALMLSGGDTSDPLFILVVILSVGVFVLFTFLTPSRGKVIISEGGKKIVLGKMGLFSKGLTIDVDPGDYVILRRIYTIHVSPTSSKSARVRRRRRARLQMVMGMKDERDAMIYEERDFDGYIASVPRYDISPEEKARIDQISRQFDYETFGNKSIVETWIIYYKPYGTNEMFEIFKKGGEYAPEINEMTEKIAENCGIRMIDHTGAVPEIIAPSETETSIATKVRAANVTPLGIDDLKIASDRIKVEEVEDGIMLTGVSDKITFSDFFRVIVGIALLFLFVPWYIRSIPGFVQTLLKGEDFIFPVIGFFFFSLFIYLMSWIGFRLIDGIYMKDMIIVQGEDIKYIKRKLISKKELILPMDEIERVIVVEKGLFFTIELVSDNKRVPFGYGYSADEALKFRDLIVSHLQ